MPPAKPARAHTPRAPRKKRVEVSLAQEPAEEAVAVAAEVVPLPELRSRQFGEPIE